MAGIKAPYRNKMKTPAKTVGRIALDLIKAYGLKQRLFNSNGYISGAVTTPDPDGFRHDILSLTHEDTVPAAVVRGDLITGQGVNPYWMRLAKGTEGQVLTMIDANDPDWADPTGELTPIGPTLIVVGRTTTIDCGAITEDAIDIFVDVSCQNMGSGIVFKATQSMARIGGKITYYWYVDSGNLMVKTFNDSDVDAYVMVWFGLPTLVVAGAFNVRTVVANTLATIADDVLYCTTGGITVTLYTAVGNTGRNLYIDNDSAGNVTVDGDGAETIENQLTQTLTPDTSMHIYSTGAKWRII